MLCNHPHYLVPELSRHPKGKPHQQSPRVSVQEPTPMRPAQARQGVASLRAQAPAHLERLVELVDQAQPGHLLLHLQQLRVHGDGEVEELLRVGQLLAAPFMPPQLPLKAA